MEIKSIKIEGFKSIGSITIENPNPFTVFVGPNASGKSNIFQAIEFIELCNLVNPFEVSKMFGNLPDIINQKIAANIIQFEVKLDKVNPIVSIEHKNNQAYYSWSFIGVPPKETGENGTWYQKDASFIQFTNFTRLFVGKRPYLPKNDDSKLSTDASNLEKVLKRILKNDSIREEIMETLILLIPGFSKIDVATEPLSGNDSLLVYEKALGKPLPKHLISDGTDNILSIIAALYQSDTPQFLCIEEPENGINPKVVRELVSIIRSLCNEKEHYIWLNTHSQTLVSELTPKEIILVDKKDGLTQIKQIRGADLQGLRMDEALLTNAIGGGIPW